MDCIDVDGYRIHVQQRGTGPPVLLVHGSASDHRTWQGQAQLLAGDFAVLNYSRRHHYPNAPIEPGAEYSMRRHLDDLQQLVETRCAMPANIVGHSYGGLLALLLAMERPQLVRSMVLMEPPAITMFTEYPPRPLQLLRLLATHPAIGTGLLNFGLAGVMPATLAARRGDMDRALQHFGPAVLGKAAFNALAPERLEQTRANSSPEELLSTGFMEPLSRQRLRSVGCPVLLVTGQQSPRLWRRLTDHLQGLLPRAERLDLPGASHIMHEDNPAGFHEAVSAFLKRM